MCGPTKEAVRQSSDQLNEEPKPVVQHNGYRYGTISLALAVTAGSVTMGHFNSRRDALGCDSMCIGSMTSARSLLALIGATLIGRISDSKSLDSLGGARKVVLFIGILASALELFLASQAASISTLWISLIPSALLNQNFTVLKALFGDYDDATASAAERAGRVGKLGMAAGLAFMVGPLASSTLFTTYQQAAAFGALCLALALFFVAMLPLPENQDAEVESIPKKAPSTQSLWSRIIPDFVPAARTAPALFIMTVRIGMTLAFHIFQTIWTVALRERFNFGPKEYGRYFGFIGFAYAMSQGFLAKFLIQKYGQTSRGRARLLLLCSLMLGGGRLLVYHTNSLPTVYAVFGGIITALGVVNTIFTADTSKIASPQELGGLFGVLSSVESVAGIAGPIMGGALSKIHPELGPLTAVVALYGIVFGFVYFGYDRYVGSQSSDQLKKVS